MYCSLTDEEAANGIFYLPRNLSYSESSYLDAYSVSSNFVFNPSQDRRHFYASECRRKIMSCLSEKFVSLSADTDADSDVPNVIVIQEKLQKPALDFDNQNFYLNKMDDLDSVGSSNGKSSISDDANNSIQSPDFDDLHTTSQGYEASLGEAVMKAMKSMEISGKNKSPPPFCVEEDSEKEPLVIRVDDLSVDIDNFENENGATEDKSDKKYGSQKSLLDSPLYEENEFNFCKAELRKSSSLKSSKTPPGTPSRKKMVRFADAMGLDLESVRHVLNADNPPKIPASAMADLQAGLESDRKEIGNRYLTACFQQPGASENFLQTVLAQKICLENAVITDLTITGVVRVANIGFHKTVRVRFTTNNWASFHDVMASYVLNSCDGPTDRFSFSIVAPADFCVNSKLEFALSFTVGDMVYWDNNQGNNYVFECFAKTTPTESRDSWLHFV